MDLNFLPHFNVFLNAASAVLLVVGLVFIKQKRIEAHRNCMTTAVVLSVLFLVLYVVHKAWRATADVQLHTTFNMEGSMKTLYLVILFTHLVLAITVPFFAGRLLYLGLKRRDEAHRKLAKIGYPVWMYVAVTGVVIYLMLYHFNPPVAVG